VGYRLIADVTMVVHFAFLGYVALGGFLAWRWPRLIWPHLAVAAWGLISIAGADCPLTLLEDWARRAAGEAGLPPSGFIDHYIEGVVYPGEYSRIAQLAVAAVVGVSWAGFARRRLRSRAGRTPSVRSP
jgi:Protein of Unknown function (DUF2784).